MLNHFILLIVMPQNHQFIIQFLANRRDPCIELIIPQRFVGRQFVDRRRIRGQGNKVVGSQSSFLASREGHSGQPCLSLAQYCH